MYINIFFVLKVTFGRGDVDLWGNVKREKNTDFELP